MWQRSRSWLAALPYRDGLERRQAQLVQSFEIGVLIAALALTPLPFFAPMGWAGQATIAALVAATAAVAAAAIGLLRAGRDRASALLLTAAIAALLSVMLYGNTLEQGGLTLFAFSLPITMSGLLIGRRGLLAVLAISLLGVGAAVLLQRAGAPGAGFAAARTPNIASAMVSFAVLAGLLAMFIDSIGAIARAAFGASRARELELEALSRKLESLVRERTADLEMALGSLELRAAEQDRLILENGRQQQIIRQLSVPVLPISATTMVLPLVGALDGERLRNVEERALAALEQSSARQLLLDITGVPLVDGPVAAGLIRVLQAARLLGADVALVGVRPEVAQAIVGLGLDLTQMRTYADLQSALRRP